jgi:nitroreductase
LQKKVGILGTGFPPAWRDKAQLEAAMNDTTPGTLDETIRGSPAVLVLVYDTRKRAPASEGDVLGMLSLGCVMENMWLMAEDLDIGFQIMSVFSGPVQKEVKKILRIPEHLGISFAVRLVPGCPIAHPEGTQGKRIVYVPQCVRKTLMNLIPSPAGIPGVPFFPDREDLLHNRHADQP